MTDTRSMVQLASIALGSWALYLLAPILTPFLVGGLLAYLGNPVVKRLVKWRSPRPLAVALVFLFFLAMVSLFFFYITPALHAQLIAFSAKVPYYLDWLQYTALPQLEALLGVDLGIDIVAVRDSLIAHWREAGNGMKAFFIYLTQSGLSLLGWAVNLLLIPVVTFYLLLDWEKLLANVLTLFPSHRQPFVARLAHETDEVLGSFLRGQLLVMTALAIVYSVGLTWVGLDLALPIGILAGLVSFVPYLGFITGLLSAVLAAYLQYHDTLVLLSVVGVFLTGQVLESLWLTPRLVGKRIGLHPVAVIFAVMAGGRIFGFTGVLLALPAAAVLKVWLRHLHDFYISKAPGQPSKKIRSAKRPVP